MHAFLHTFVNMHTKAIDTLLIMAEINDINLNLTILGIGEDVEQLEHCQWECKM